METQDWNRPFSPDWLQRSEDERKKYFRDRFMAHPAITKAKNDLYRILNNPVPGLIVLVFGAPGVGKTTLCRIMVRDLLAKAQDDPNYNLGRIPVAGIELEAFAGGVHKWKQTRKAMLQSLHEPLIDKKVMYRIAQRDSDDQLIVDRLVTGDDLGKIVVDVLKARKTNVYYFDEAQHLAMVRGADGLKTQMDIVKSTANLSGTTPVLFGTYEMNSMIELSAQLGRRTQIVPIGRYKPDNETDVESFQKVLFGFQRHMPLPIEPDLVEQWDYFFEGSLGCIGMLKDWLTQAVGDAIDDNMDTLDIDHCERWLPPGQYLIDRLNRIQEGEKQFQDARNRIKLRTILGLPTNLAHKNKDRSAQTTTPKKVRPFERIPTRDIVGLSNDE